ncbi:unnamed protein product [Rotaria socialis]|uniref:Uncharacterized protein n=2 Tax=Rotaria socialis TaxID=392032 RepID=A0A818LDI9_9BILA|nr:unnamed protein product [Rotaria socialis]
MNNNSDLMHLENLLDEIFLHEIFPLFSWDELYYSFSGLNKRITTVLRSLMHLDFTVDSSTQHHPALAFFLSTITRLNVRLGKFDIKSFSALCSLTLGYPSLQQRNSIRPENFPYLEYLSLSYPLEDTVLLNLIFSDAFERLTVCRFDRTSTDHSWSTSPKIRSLSISVHGPYGIICVLRACPNISRLNMIVYPTSQINLSLPKHSFSCMNFHLRRLSIRSIIEMLPSIFKLTPNLEWLTFDDILCYDGFENSQMTFKNFVNALFMLNHISYLYLKTMVQAWDQYISLNTLHPLFKHISYYKAHSGVTISSLPV